MNNFIRKTTLTILSFIAMLSIIFILKNPNYFLKKVSIKEDSFSKKNNYFSDFFKKHESINLILGSSITRDLVVPAILGDNWFSFCNGSQTIYESFKFLSFFKDSIKIDTIIVGIQPFDFPYSYIENRSENKPGLHGNFFIYGEDSITNIMKLDNFLLKLQKIKDQNFYNLNKHMINRQQKIDNVKNRINYMDSQGFKESTKIAKKNPSFNDNAKNYFYNLQIPPNLKYFKLFNNLAEELNIVVVYIVTPKHKYYRDSMKSNGLNDIWVSVLDSVKTQTNKLWDYENMDTDRFGFYWYSDETHAGKEGSIMFTKIIKKRLKEEYSTTNP